jgi:hypothetical protein
LNQAPPAGAAPGARAQDREAKAEKYFAHDLAGQRAWYGKKAASAKSRARALGLTIIATGAATSFVQVFAHALWVTIVTALLGALVTVAEGWKQIARYDETWAAYRTASERMKRERRLYTNGAGAYRALADEEAAFVAFVGAIEAIIAEEQQIYWRDRSTPPAPAKPQ